MDAVLYHHLSRLSRKQAEAIDTNKVKFVASDFAHKLANHVGGTIEEGGIQVNTNTYFISAAALTD